MKVKSIVATVILVLCIGCDIPKRTASDVLEEQVVVRDLVFAPSQHGSGTGMTMKGTLTWTSVTVQEKRAIVFECPHGSFVVESMDELWSQLREGDTCTALYREIYSESNTERHLVDYDFLGVKEHPELIEDSWVKK